MTSCDKCGEKVRIQEVHTDEASVTYCRDCWNVRGCEDLFDMDVEKFITNKE